jgi:hypothetical protein
VPTRLTQGLIEVREVLVFLCGTGFLVWKGLILRGLFFCGFRFWREKPVFLTVLEGWIDQANQVGVVGRDAAVGEFGLEDGADGAGGFGQVGEEVLDHVGEGGVAFGGPDAGFAELGVGDGDGDVAHG